MVVVRTVGEGIVVMMVTVDMMSLSSRRVARTTLAGSYKRVWRNLLIDLEVTMSIGLRETAPAPTD